MVTQAASAPSVELKPTMREGRWRTLAFIDDPNRAEEVKAEVDS